MLSAEVHIFPHRHIAEELAAFRALHHAARAIVAAVFRSGRAPDGCRRNRAQARDGVEQRGLAGAVEPDHRDELAGVDMDRHVSSARALP